MNVLGVQYVTSTLYVHVHTDKHWLGRLPPKSTVMHVDTAEAVVTLQGLHSNYASNGRHDCAK